MNDRKIMPSLTAPTVRSSVTLPQEIIRREKRFGPFTKENTVSVEHITLTLNANTKELIAYLNEQPKITTLDLYRAKIDIPNIITIASANIPSLTKIKCPNTAITDEVLPSFFNNLHLKSLDLNTSKINLTTLLHFIHNNKTLTELSINDYATNINFLFAIAALKDNPLKKLNIIGGNISAKKAAEFSRLNNCIQSLYLEKVCLPEGALINLAKEGCLKELFLGPTTFIEQKEFVDFAAENKTITSFGSAEMNDESLLAIANSKQLEKLKLDNHCISDKAFLTFLQQNNSVHHLEVEDLNSELIDAITKSKNIMSVTIAPNYSKGRPAYILPQDKNYFKPYFINYHNSESFEKLCSHLTENTIQLLKASWSFATPLTNAPHLAQTFLESEVKNIKELNHRVYLAEYKNQIVVIKDGNRYGITGNSSSTISIEANLLGSFNHPCITRLLGCSFVNPVNYNYYYERTLRIKDKPLLMIEYAELGSLDNWLDSIPTTNLIPNIVLILLQILRDIAEGLNYLHDKHYVFFDIKPDNIVIIPDKKANLRAKLIDFGSCRHPNDPDFLTSPKTYHYSSPEAFTLERDSKRLDANDIYSFGLLLAESFSTKEKFKAIKSLIKDDFLFSSERFRNDLTSKILHSLNVNCPIFIMTLIKNCLSFESIDRPIIKEVIIQLDKAAEALNHKLLIPTVDTMDQPLGKEENYYWIEEILKHARNLTYSFNLFNLDNTIYAWAENNLYHACLNYMKFFQLTIKEDWPTTESNHLLCKSTFFYRAFRTEKIMQTTALNKASCNLIEEYSVDKEFVTGFMPSQQR